MDDGASQAKKVAAATVAAVATMSVVPRDAVHWCAVRVRDRLGWGEKERHSIVIHRQSDDGEKPLFDAACKYLDARIIDPRAIRRLSLESSRPISESGRWLLRMEPGCSATDVFDGVVFTWTSVAGGPSESLELSFEAEHKDTALERYLPFVVSTALELDQDRTQRRIFRNEELSWHGIDHDPPATFDTVAMDPELKQSIIADLDRFLGTRRAWKHGYLLHGPPGTGKSSLVAAIANYLRFNLYVLDLSAVHSTSTLQRLLVAMPGESILVIEDIHLHQPSRQTRITFLSSLLNVVDGSWSTCAKKRIFIITTNRVDPELQGRIDMPVYLGYCGWETFKTLARNYLCVDDMHPLFPVIEQLLAEVEVTPAEVSEMLLRREDADSALQGLVDFIEGKKKHGARRAP